MVMMNMMPMMIMMIMIMMMIVVLPQLLFLRVSQIGRLHRALSLEHDFTREDAPCKDIRQTYHFICLILQLSYDIHCNDSSFILWNICSLEKLIRSQQRKLTFPVLSRFPPNWRLSFSKVIFIKMWWLASNSYDLQFLLWTEAKNYANTLWQVLLLLSENVCCLLQLLMFMLLILLPPKKTIRSQGLEAP